MTAKDRIAENNRQEAEQRLREFLDSLPRISPDDPIFRRSNEEEIGAERDEPFIVTSGGELSLSEYREIYGEPHFDFGARAADSQRDHAEADAMATDSDHGRDNENFTGWYEDQGEMILRTSTGELSQRDYEMLYGDPTRYWTEEQHAEAARMDEHNERQREKMNRELEAEQ